MNPVALVIRDQCCEVLGTKPELIFDRRTRSWARGKFKENPPEITLRHACWLLMAASALPGNPAMRLSYPEIAEACGSPTHSTVQEAIKKSVDPMVLKALRRML